MGPAAKAAVPDLTQALKDVSPDVRREAAAALGQIGPAAKLAAPALTELLKDKDEGVRREAAETLEKIKKGP